MTWVEWFEEAIWTTPNEYSKLNITDMSPKEVLQQRIYSLHIESADKMRAAKRDETEGIRLIKRAHTLELQAEKVDAEIKELDAAVQDINMKGAAKPMTVDMQASVGLKAPHE